MTRWLINYSSKKEGLIMKIDLLDPKRITSVIHQHVTDSRLLAAY